MGSLRILILYITPKSGHHRAAIAIQKAISLVNPEIEVTSLDVFNYTNPVLNKIVHKTYLHIIKRRPEVWEYLYDNPRVVFRTQRFKTLIHKYNSKKLLNLLSQYQPGVIITTQAFPCGMIADLKKYYGVNLPLIGVLTDYVAHSFWFYENVDLYIVPHNSTRERMLQSGIPESNIRVYGIPIDPDFATPVNKIEVLGRLGLDSEKPVVLIMGGGRGIGEIKQVLYSLYKVDSDFQIIVVCGANRRLFKYFKRRESKFAKFRKIKLLEYVENVYELMSISDILISKPGGITTAEALATGLPLIIFKPLPGQEVCNSEFLLQIGAAIRCEKISDLPVLVKELLTRKDKLALMSQNARKYSHPNSSVNIAMEAIRLLNKVYV